MSQSITEETASLLGFTAYKIIKESFGDREPGERKCFKLANFTLVETKAFLKICEENDKDTSLAHTQIVVASDTPESIPRKYQAKGSITNYRNNIDSGHRLIYIETNTQSDSQGLKNIFTLRDSNFLDGSFDSDEFHVPSEIVSGAIKSAFGKEDPSHQILITRCVDVLKGLHENGIAVSVRKFAAFSLAVAHSRSKQKKALDGTQLDALVGANLSELGIFGDIYWRAVSARTRISRRLAQNYLHADLASSISIDLDQDKLAESCGSVVFQSFDSVDFDLADQSRWRDLCRSYCMNPTQETRIEIPYYIFEQLFKRDLKGLGLGDRVELEIERSYSSRLPEYDKLNVKAGLNKRDSDDAIRFLDEESLVSDDFPLRDLVSSQTRRMIEKVAYPNPEKFPNPLIKLAEITELFRNNSKENTSSKEIVLRLSPRANESAPSIGLFSFLYGPTLKSLSEASRLSVNEGFTFNIDPQLCKPIAPPELKIFDDEELEEEDPITWTGVSIEFALICSETGEELEIEQALVWLPPAIEMLALFWLLTSADDSPKPGHSLFIPANQPMEDWVSALVSRTSKLDSYAQSTGGPEVQGHHIVEKLNNITQDFRTRAKDRSLSAELLNACYDDWSLLLQNAKDTLIPDGAEDPYLKAILSAECAIADEDSILMLASHPLRMRWIALYLQKSETLAMKALAGELPLNTQNRTFYLDWIANLSPHQNPAIHVSPSGQRLLSSTETGWAEIFTPLHHKTSSELNENIAPSSVKEIANQVTTYLAAHPYKKDGLTLLIVSPTTPGFSANLISLIRSGEWKDVRISMNLIAPRKSWPKAISQFERIPSGTRLSGSDSLFPDIQLNLYDLEKLESSDDGISKINADIAIIPQFLNDEITIQEITAPTSSEEGSFDPLLDQPTYIRGGNHGGVISVAQRPMTPDSTLLNWSTIVVRQSRMGPVSPQMSENTDLLELRINFQNASRLFNLLHNRAHWVITLEKYITRAQIEALENRPEILTVKNNVGPNGAFTLIVSSNIGQQFIVNRLERKLEHIVTESGDSNRTPAVLKQVAESIYRETREIAPWLTLKAMGISRVSEEILGLIVGRRVLEEKWPLECSKGISVWISLDDHQNWFGGENGTRADLCRITLDHTDNGLEVDLVVLESKLRKSTYDPHGIKQVDATQKLFSELMPPLDPSVEAEHVDSRLWRETILSAIEAVNPSAITIVDTQASDGDLSHLIPRTIRSAFREGSFKLRTFAGLYSICLYGQRGSLSILEDPGSSNIHVARSYGNDLLSIIQKDGSIEYEIPRHIRSEGRNSANIESSNSKNIATAENESIAIPADDKQRSPRANLEKKKTTSTPIQKLSNSELETRYQEILNTYAEFNVQVVAVGNMKERFVEGPASVLYRIEPGAGVSPDKIRQQGESLKIKLKLAEEQQVRFSIAGGYITIDVPKSPADRFFISADQLWKEWKRPTSELAVPIGIDTYGKTVSLNFSSSNSPHLLIGGTTGSGKSEALNTILGGLIEHYSVTELKLMLVDPKGTELTHLENDDHLHGEIGMNDEDAISLLDQAVDEMEKRYKLFKEVRVRSLLDYNAKSTPDKAIPWWFIVLDEYADLTSEKDSKRAIEDRLKRLAQKARAAGIHLVIATQKPAGEVISTNLRSNLPAQLALRVKSSIESRVIIDETGAETLNGMGDALLKSEGKLIRVQCAKL